MSILEEIHIKNFARTINNLMQRIHPDNESTENTTEDIDFELIKPLELSEGEARK